MIEPPIIVAACLGCYFIGWAMSYLFYVFRRFTWNVT